jgi:hypothetical protein
MSNGGKGGDHSAVALCEVLQYARQVFLEDAVIMQPLYPEFPAYQHKVFRLFSGLFQSYSMCETSRTQMRELHYKQKDADLRYQLQQMRLDVQGGFQQLRSAIAAVQPTSTPPEPLPAVAAPSSSSRPAKAPAASSSSSSSSSGTLPPFPISITNMREFWGVWTSSLKPAYSVYLAANKRFKWTAHFGAKQGQILKKRLSPCKSWINFLDSLEPEAADRALSLMEEMAASSNIGHPSMVKLVFHNCVHTSTQCEAKYRVYATELRALLEAAGFIVPVVAGKST